MTTRRQKPRPRPEPLRCRCGQILSPYALEDEAARYIRRATQTLRNMRVRGDGPPYQQSEPGGVVTYAFSDLDMWMRERTRYSTSDVRTEDRAAVAAVPH